MALLHAAQKLDALQRHEAVRRPQRRANARKQRGEEPELLRLGNDEERTLDLAEVQNLARRVRPGPGADEEARDGARQLRLRQHHRVEELRHGVERGEDDGRPEQPQDRVEEPRGEGADEVPRAELQQEVELPVVREDVRPRAIGARGLAGGLAGRRAARENDQLGELADAAGLLEGQAALDLLFEKEGKRAGEGVARLDEDEEQAAQKHLQIELLLGVRRVQLADQNVEQPAAVRFAAASHCASAKQPQHRTIADHFGEKKRRGVEVDLLARVDQLLHRLLHCVAVLEQTRNLIRTNSTILRNAAGEGAAACCTSGESG